MIAAFDVHYPKGGGAVAAAVLFLDYRDASPAAEHVKTLADVDDYVPGELFRRELPCLLALLDQIDDPVEELIVDGYVMLGRDRPGLGWHLFTAVDEKIPVIGVAKSRFTGACPVEVFRGGGGRPLYITAADMDLRLAAEKIRAMHGNYRIPTLLKWVDLLARRGGM
jgi:deoxyribonuclease V